MNLYKYLSLINSIIIWPLISFGAFVRLEGAGLSCPDWPLCYGKIIPPANYEIYLEVGHRAVATAVGIICILMVLIGHFNTKVKPLQKLNYALLAMVVFQGVLGGLTVIYKVNPISVTSHLFFGNILFMQSLYLTLKAFYPNTLKLTASMTSLKKQKVWLLLTLFFIILISGGVNSSTYSGSYCRAFPLCAPDDPGSFSIDMGYTPENQVVPATATELIDKYGQSEYIHLLHRLIAIVGSLWMFWIIFRNVVSNHSIKVRVLNMILVALLVTEIGIGIFNALLGVPVPISIFHTAIASSITGILSVLYFHSCYPEA